MHGSFQKAECIFTSTHLLKVLVQGNVRSPEAQQIDSIGFPAAALASLLQLDVSLELNKLNRNLTSNKTLNIIQQKPEHKHIHFMTFELNIKIPLLEQVLHYHRVPSRESNVIRTNWNQMIEHDLLDLL